VFIVKKLVLMGLFLSLLIILARMILILLITGVVSVVFGGGIRLLDLLTIFLRRNWGFVLVVADHPAFLFLLGKNMKYYNKRSQIVTKGHR